MVLPDYVSISQWVVGFQGSLGIAGKLKAELMALSWAVFGLVPRL